MEFFDASGTPIGQSDAVPRPRIRVHAVLNKRADNGLVSVLFLKVEGIPLLVLPGGTAVCPGESFRETLLRLADQQLGCDAHLGDQPLVVADYGESEGEARYHSAVLLYGGEVRRVLRPFADWHGKTIVDAVWIPWIDIVLHRENLHPMFRSVQSIFD